MIITENTLEEIKVRPNESIIVISCIRNPKKSENDGNEIDILARIQGDSQGLITALAKILQEERVLGLFEAAKKKMLMNKLLDSIPEDLLESRRNAIDDIAKSEFGNEDQKKSTTMNVNPSDPVGPKYLHEDIFGAPNAGPQGSPEN